MLADVDFDDIHYFVRASERAERSWDDVPEDVKNTFDRLGIPEAERKFLAGVGAQYESEVVYHQIREDLEQQGVIFKDMDSGLREHEDLVREYFATIIPNNDNKLAALNSAVWSGGSFVYVPPGVQVEMPLQAYFRINTENMGQFERTLIIADEGSYVHYVEGCTAPMRDENQLHAAVVELVALDDAEIKYSTVQNWYPGDAEGKGGIYNFVTKRANCLGKNSKVSWTQVETGSAITWKYPSCVLSGDGSVGEFYSVAVTNNRQQADTGTKMIHLGKNTTSTIVSKGISAGRSSGTYRGLVRVAATAEGARNHTQCDSLLLGSQCGAHTVPYIEVRNPSATIEHEATTSKISDDQVFYAQSRGLDAEAAVSLIVNGFCREVLQQLPMEFAVEAQKLLGISLEGSVG
jgi:Fe-S cluster assembly protein SufB